MIMIIKAANLGISPNFFLYPQMQLGLIVEHLWT